MQPRVEIYSADYCPYCLRAKQLLERKGIHYHEIRIDLDAEKRAEMIERTGHQTIPKILIDGKLIGGFDDLWNFDQDGRLDLLFPPKS